MTKTRLPWEQSQTHRQVAATTRRGRCQSGGNPSPKGGEPGSRGQAESVWQLVQGPEGKGTPGTGSSAGRSHRRGHRGEVRLPSVSPAPPGPQGPSFFEVSGSQQRLAMQPYLHFGPDTAGLGVGRSSETGAMVGGLEGSEKADGRS